MYFVIHYLVFDFHYIAHDPKKIIFANIHPIGPVLVKRCACNTKK